MLKKLIVFLFAVSMFNVMAVDFSYNMSVANAKAYVAEHQNDEKKTDNYYTALAIDFVAEHQDATYQNIVDLIGLEYALQTAYQIHVSVASEYKTIFSNLLLEELKNNFNVIANTKYFNDVIIARHFYINKQHKEYGIYAFIVGNFTVEQIREIIFTHIDNRIDNANDIGEFSNYINDNLLHYIKSYQAIYLSCDEQTVKEDLRKLNTKAYMLLEVSEEYKTFVTRLRMLYKSIDF